MSSQSSQQTSGAEHQQEPRVQPTFDSWEGRRRHVGWDWQAADLWHEEPRHMLPAGGPAGWQPPSSQPEGESPEQASQRHVHSFRRKIRSGRTAREPTQRGAVLVDSAVQEWQRARCFSWRVVWQRELDQYPSEDPTLGLGNANHPKWAHLQSSLRAYTFSILKERKLCYRLNRVN